MIQPESGTVQIPVLLTQRPDDPLLSSPPPTASTSHRGKAEGLHTTPATGDNVDAGAADACADGRARPSPTGDSPKAGEPAPFDGAAAGDNPALSGLRAATLRTGPLIAGHEYGEDAHHQPSHSGALQPRPDAPPSFTPLERELIRKLYRLLAIAIAGTAVAGSLAAASVPREVEIANVIGGQGR